MRLVGVYLDKEAREIISRVRERLARELGISPRDVSVSMVIKHLYHRSQRLEKTV